MTRHFIERSTEQFSPGAVFLHTSPLLEKEGNVFVSALPVD